LIETEREILQLLTDLAGGRGEDLFGIGPTVDGETGPASGTHPDGWIKVSLGAVLSPVSDRVQVEPGTLYPNIGVYSFGRGLFEKADIDGSATSATVLNRVRAGQFIYSRLFAFEGAYASVPPEFDGYFVSGEFPTFEPDPTRLDARWLAMYLRSPDRWSELGSASKGLGVRRQRVPAEAILAYTLWLPPLKHQEKMINVLEKIDELRSLRAAGATRLDALLPAALNEAFAGLS
jgi:type I restriction enzyme S subunit